MKNTSLLAAAAAIAMAITPADAQYLHGGSHGTDQPHLHTSNRWKECSFQLDASLTQDAWKQFTREAGLVAYFRPLVDAQPMGRGKFEISMLKYNTAIDDNDAAWNDTFVHPDSAHWLFEGSGLSFPGFAGRVGVTSSTDVGVYWTRNPNANYGFWGGQLQQSIVRDTSRAMYAAVRVSYSALYGPDDLTFGVGGADLVASKTFALSRRIALSPYAGVSAFVNRSHERAAAVSLDDETVVGGQAMLGASLKLPVARLAAEYNVAAVNSFSLKIGFGR